MCHLGPGWAGKVDAAEVREEAWKQQCQEEIQPPAGEEVLLDTEVSTVTRSGGPVPGADQPAGREHEQRGKQQLACEVGRMRTGVGGGSHSILLVGGGWGQTEGGLECHSTRGLIFISWVISRKGHTNAPLTPGTPCPCLGWQPCSRHLDEVVMPHSAE